MITSIARIAATAAAVVAMGIGLASTASAVTGEPREDAAVAQGCSNTGLTVLGCVQLNNVLNDLDVLSDVVETVEITVPVEDVTAQLPIVGSGIITKK